MSQVLEQEFLDVLLQLVHLNEKLLHAFQQERQALLTQNIQELRRINTEEMKIGNDLRDAELRRRRVIGDLMGISKNDTKPLPKLPEIIARAAAPYRELFAANGNRLRDVLSDILRVRNLNNRLIERTLRFNEKSIRLFLTLGQKDLTYDVKGAMQKTDRRVVNSLA